MTPPDTSAAPPRNGFVQLYTRVLWAFAGLSMAAIVGIMLVQVVARYLFGASLIWAEELCRYILIWQTFLLIGIAYSQGELVALDLIGTRIAGPWRFLIRLIVSLPVCYFLYLLIETGLVHADRFKSQTIPAIDFIWGSLTGRPAGLPVWWIYVSVPVGSVILLAHIVVGLVDEVIALARGGTGAAQPPSSNA
ncbi:TRAP transporter small permease [Phreatobacter stygius]|uniref:TRAP transporter small permease protein n=1 Tax=Phreatobacter stygius TaxID=1940610 RepID=A0A4D7B0T7_9HYPH|nr:TRAP transporter small permease subunit [Phreatobacter stygius]QCI67254.1 TRAP transporter small permease subunit [Phreatobacter stygius]